MNRTTTATLLGALAAAAVLALPAQALPDAAAPDLDSLARQALAGGPDAETAVAALRLAGAAGMERMLAAVAAGGGDLSPGQEAALDRVCGVRDCARVRLFWYTDFEAAVAAARAAGKPILSLRLLGRLDEDLSCANSRFFRTILYPDAEIGRLLRQRFVLHWRSVRPVPKLTVDFGDGRTLERTVAGNSIHYVLDPRGRLVDALPGLYGPEVFRQELSTALEAAGSMAGLADPAFEGAASRYRDERVAALERGLLEDAVRLGGAFEPRTEKSPQERDPGEGIRLLPAAARGEGDLDAAGTASKMAGEWRLLTALGLGVPREDDEWRRLAALHRPGIRLDAGSRASILAKHGISEEPAAVQLLENLAGTIALDEVLDQYLLRPQIYSHLAELSQRPDVEALNAWVYAEVFDMPPDDPWLGLAPESVYAGLPAAGSR